MPSKKKKATPGYVAHGSDEHAALLGLRPAEEDEELQRDGWTLIDRTSFGPQVTDAYLREVLRQKVTELNTPPEMPQSTDPTKPNYQPPMMRPPGQQVR